MLKKILVALVMLISFSVLANKAEDANQVKLEGEVVSIDTTANSFVVKDANNMMNTFQVTAATEFEEKCESCIIMKENILPVKFDDLTVGSWVKVKYKANTEVKVADDVKIYVQQ